MNPEAWKDFEELLKMLEVRVVLKKIELGHMVCNELLDERTFD